MGLFKKAKKNSGWMAVVFDSDAISMAHIKRITGALPQVQSAVSFPVEGQIKADAFTKIAKEAQADRHVCTTLLSSKEYQLLSVDAPNVPPDELKVAIRWRLKDMLDFHIDDATVDVLDVPVDKEAAGRAKSMFAVAARNQVIQDRQNLFSESKLTLTAIDIPELAQRNIAQLFEPEGRGLAFLSFGPEGGLLTVSFAGELYLSRRIDVTLKQLQDAGAEQKNTYFDRITLELQRSLDHFDRQYHFIAMSKLMLGPMGPVAAELKTYLGSNLYVPVEQGDLQTVLDFSSVPALLSEEAQARFFMTLGAALRLEEKVL